MRLFDLDNHHACRRCHLPQEAVVGVLFVRLLESAKRSFSVRSVSSGYQRCGVSAGLKELASWLPAEPVLEPATTHLRSASYQPEVHNRSRGTGFR